MNIELKKISKLWKAARLLAGFTQVKLSRELGIPQSSVSKYESGFLEPSALDWYRFCELVGIDAHRSLNLGFIDGRQKFKTGIYQTNLFAVPMRYRLAQELKVRELLPFRLAAIDFLGAQSWEEFLASIKIPDELFLVLDYQVSINLLLDLLAWSGPHRTKLIVHAQKTQLRLHEVGLLGREYVKKRSITDFIDAFCGASPYYQRAIEIEGGGDATTVNFRVQDWVLDTFAQEHLDPYLEYKAHSFAQILQTLYPEQTFQTLSDGPSLRVSLESA